MTRLSHQEGSPTQSNMIYSTHEGVIHTHIYRSDSFIKVSKDTPHTHLTLTKIYDEDPIMVFYYIYIERER
jgi:hypothetical protein